MIYAFAQVVVCCVVIFMTASSLALSACELDFSLHSTCSMKNKNLCSVKM